MKRILAATMVMLLIGLPTITINIQAKGQLVYVDDDNISGPWDGTTDHPYQFIQQAIDNLSQQDSFIYVAKGKYYENVIIPSQLTGLQITLWASQSDPDDKNPVLNGKGQGTGITIEASNVIISRMNITNYGQKDLDACIYIQSDTTNVRIEHNNISLAYTGIGTQRVKTGDTVHKFLYNHIFNITDRGISIVLAYANEIKNNIIEHCHWGFYIVDTNKNTIQDNEISHCFEGGVIDVGIQNSVIHNTFHDNEVIGFVTVNTKGTEITQNNFLDSFSSTSSPVWFRTFFIINSDKWSANYYGRLVFPILKLIFGEFMIPAMTPIPWIRFEWLPSEHQN